MDPPCEMALASALQTARAGNKSRHHPGLVWMLPSVTCVLFALARFSYLGLTVARLSPFEIHHSDLRFHFQGFQYYSQSNCVPDCLVQMQSIFAVW